MPFFGNLFKSETRSRKKTNLMVFLRPVVVRDAQQSDQLSIDRYDLMRRVQESTQPPASKIVPINSVPELPALGTQPPSAPPPKPAGQ
jgi:general secretion pathway protein D